MSDASDSATQPASVPAHVAIIMDGNGRWAKSRGFPRVEGHRRGADAVKTIVKTADKCGVRYLTLFGFSSENWKRPVEEVRDLMGLVKVYLRKEVAELNQNNVKFLSIGDRAKLSADVLEVIEDAEKKTAANDGLTLVLALSYGGRADVALSVRTIMAQVQAGERKLEEVTEDLISDHLSTAGMPEPDLLIRTGGDQRISNFLLWQMAYTEFVFLDCFWPDFGETEFRNALGSFNDRDRRFGKISS